MRSLTHISHSSRLHRAVATAWRRRASDTNRSCASATTNGRNGQMAGEGVSSKPAFITCTMHGWGQRVVCASTICAYQKLHLILQEWLPSECNNVLLKGMSRKKCSPSAQCRSFFLGIQPTRLNVHSYFREWSSSAPRSYFVSACEAEKPCSSVVPFLLP